MSPAEVGGRTVDRARQLLWARRQVAPGQALPRVAGLKPDREFPTPLSSGVRELIPPEAGSGLVAAADRILKGDWPLLGVERADIACPDWFFDPVTGRRAPQSNLAFQIDHRDEKVTGNVKSVWELSRHQHLTVLAGAWWLTAEERYARAVAAQLSSWWAENPFLSGIHWTSGIESGVRLISWAWIRRLLHDWSGVTDLFEDNDQALLQIGWHQEFLATFPSRGSSANNHVVAEAAGRLVGACAFPWYAKSDVWRARAAEQLQRELLANIFPSGVNRELASDYHAFVTELALVAGVEAEAFGHPLDPATWSLLASSVDAAAALLDAHGRAPRQGDGDEGRGLVLDPPARYPWALLLGLGAAVVGPRPWWPKAEPAVCPLVVGSLLPAPLAPPALAPDRPSSRPDTFADAGIVLLRTVPGGGREIWCRCDGGPHGFLSIAAHAHADALSVEVRYGGIEVLVDPGTYCYHGESDWRSYFRSTLAHNTVEIDGVSQSVEAGPFLWSTKALTRVDRVEIDPGSTQVWSAHHSGYARLDRALQHARTVLLEPKSRELKVVDHLAGSRPHTVRLAFHLGPDVRAELVGAEARLSWLDEQGPVDATLLLPEALEWSRHHGETHPILGWYSPSFGHRISSTTLLGSGVFTGSLELATTLTFEPAGGVGNPAAFAVGGVSADA